MQTQRRLIELFFLSSSIPMDPFTSHHRAGANSFGLVKDQQWPNF